MAGLGIPSTRALCVVGSETPVQREQRETGATLVRLAKSHIRFGHFEYCYYTGQHELLQTLADYAIAQYWPQLQEQTSPYADMFYETVTATARMITHWQAAGFTHGVMNTDNMSILGDTFDYGPYAFIDDFESGFICNHSDHHGRYAFNRQPDIALWNLKALANSLQGLISKQEQEHALQSYKDALFQHYDGLVREKLGLQQTQEDVRQLMGQLQAIMESEQLDYHQTFRQLCDFNSVKDNPIRDNGVNREAFDRWAERYQKRLQAETVTPTLRQQYMRLHNPKFVLRNYLAQQAIEQAQQRDFSLVDKLLTVLSSPYEEHSNLAGLAEPPPDWGKRLEISCSS